MGAEGKVAVEAWQQAYSTVALAGVEQSGVIT